MSSGSPLLVVDVGNSRTKFGLFRDWSINTPGQLPVCEHLFAISIEDEPFPWSQLRAALAGVAPLSLIAAVNPPMLERLLEEWPRTEWPEPRFVASNAALPIVNETLYPERVGADRLLKAIAGNVLRPAGLPLILVDSGTATTVDWITPSGAFMGGAILPGLRLSSQALHDHTALLPLIAIESFRDVPPAAIGSETRSALQSGIYWGQIGAIRELIQRMTAEQGGELPTVLITGGGGELVARELNRLASYHRDLTLQGLAVAARTLNWSR